MIRLDLALQGLGAAQDEGGERGEHHHQGDQDRAELPVEKQRHRQEHDQGDERGAMIAEEAEPGRRHAARALQHRLQHPAGMVGRVEGERQVEDVLEVVRHRRQPAAMGEPVGMEGDQHPGADREQPERHPEGDEAEQARGARAPGGHVGEAVDDAAEQNRLGEGRHRQGDVGGGQKRPEAQIGPELAHDPNVEPDQPHGR